MASLTPEQLAWLQANERNNTPLQDGSNYWSLLNSSGVGSEGYGDPSIFGNGKYIYGSHKPFDPYRIIDEQGKDTGRSGIHGGDADLGKFGLMMAAMLAGGAALGGGFGGLGAGGGSGALGAGAADMGAFGGFGVAGDAYLPGALSIGGNVGATAPLAGFDAYLASGAGAAGGAAGGAMGAGGGAGAAGAGSALSGGASNLLGGASSWLGPVATAAGALLGSKPQEQSSEQTRKMDPRMDALFYGDLAPRVQGLLAQQMPQAQKMGDQMMGVGGGLLSQPVAGNGFGMFTRGRYGQ